MYTVISYTRDFYDFKSLPELKLKSFSTKKEDGIIKTEFTFDSFIEAVKLYKQLDPICVSFIMRETPETCLYIM